jgi:hypothetical protein
LKEQQSHFENGIRKISFIPEKKNIFFSNVSITSSESGQWQLRTVSQRNKRIFLQIRISLSKKLGATTALLRNSRKNKPTNETTLTIKQNNKEAIRTNEQTNKRTSETTNK